MMNLNGLLKRQAEYIPGAFDPGLVTIKDVYTYLNTHKISENELQLIHPQTNQKVFYNVLNQPWRSAYDPDSIESLWEEGFAFILHSPFINKKIKKIVHQIEKQNLVSCDAHVYCGKKNSSSFLPHSDSSFNLIVQCVGKSAWRIWPHITREPGQFEELVDETPSIKVVMNPGDAMIVPVGQIHQAEPLTDRISVSFPFSPGPKTIHKDIKLSWE